MAGTLIIVPSTIAPVANYGLGAKGVRTVAKEAGISPGDL
jgi:hypothetical protein